MRCEHRAIFFSSLRGAGDGVFCALELDSELRVDLRATRYSFCSHCFLSPASLDRFQTSELSVEHEAKHVVHRWGLGLRHASLHISL